jgi:WD40 repeat protein
LPDGAIARIGTIRWRHGSPITSLLFSPDGNELVSAGENGIKKWGVATGLPLATERVNFFSCAAFSPDGKLLAVADALGNIRFLEKVTGRKIPPLATNQRNLFSLAFSPDNKLLASAAYDGSIAVWDLAAGAEILQTPGDGRSWRRPVTFSPDGKLLVYGGPDDAILIANIDKGKLIRRIQEKENELTVLAISAGGWSALGRQRWPSPARYDKVPRHYHRQRGPGGR